MKKEERGKRVVENRQWKIRSCFLLLIVFLLSACSTSNVIESHEAWVRNANQGEITAVYMILHNHTDIDDAIIGVSTDVAEAAEMHLSEVQNDVMSMTPQERIEIPAGGEVVLESGGYHIMLIGLKQDLNVGDEISITLYFENYPDVVVTVPVRESAEEHQSHP